MGTVSTLINTGVPISPGTVATIPFNEVLSDEQKTELKRLRSTHELWKVFQPDWELYLACYEGGSEVTNANHIFQHSRENDLDYQERIRRANYENYCDVLVDFFSNFIFTETIHRDGGENSDWYAGFITDVDGKGTDIDSFMKSFLDDIDIFGMVYTLVDAPPAPPNIEVVTVQHEKDYKIRPYWVPLQVGEVTDWVCDEQDNLLYLKRKQFLETIRGRDRVKLEKYTEWYLDEVVITEVDVTDPQKPSLGPPVRYMNTLPYIPIRVDRYKRSKKYPWMGISFLRDLAPNNREVLNLSSLRQEFLYRQCFNILAKESDTVLPLKDVEDGVLSQSNVIDYPKGANPPQYISPPSDPAKFISETEQRLVNNMFRRAAQDTLNELFNGEGRSGFSQAQQFSKTVPFIATRADILEKAEAGLMSMTLARLGKTWDGKIKYKDRYELTNITDTITQLSMLAKDLGIQSPTFFKEEMKRLIAEFDGKIPTEIKAKIESEIDGMNMDGWFKTQKEALVGQPKSPAGQQKDKSSGTMAEASAEARTGATNKTR
jgi:hypothetical protein